MDARARRAHARRARSGARVLLCGLRSQHRATRRALASAPPSSSAPCACLVPGSSAERAHANVEGVDVHAEVAFDGRDRPRLERLIRYVTRPPLATCRLDEHAGGRVRYGFKKAWKDGTHAVVLKPLDFIARLAAIVPPPRWHLIRYHHVLGVLGSLRSPCARSSRDGPCRQRQRTRRGRADEDSAADPGRRRATVSPSLCRRSAARPQATQGRALASPWSWLLMRVFNADVTTCERGLRRQDAHR